MGQAHNVRNEFHLEHKAWARTPSKYVVELLQNAIGFFRKVSDLLYENSLNQARSGAGRTALYRMLAARCVLSGKRRGGHDPIYRDFTINIEAAIRSALYRRHDYFGEITSFLTDRNGFDFSHRWLEAMAGIGDPGKATETMQEELKPWEPLKGEPYISGVQLGLVVAGATAASYLDGLCHGLNGNALVLIDDYTSPFGRVDDFDMDQLQWEVLPSATCQLHANGRRKEDLVARVAWVPELWMEAIRHPEGFLPREGLVILRQGGERLLHLDTETCTTIADSIAKSCHAEILSEVRRAPSTATAREHRKAIKAAQLVIRSKGWQD